MQRWWAVVGFMGQAMNLVLAGFMTFGWFGLLGYDVVVVGGGVVGGFVMVVFFKIIFVVVFGGFDIEFFFGAMNF